MENTINSAAASPSAGSLLITRTGTAILEDTLNSPVPKMLFSEFWSQGELSVLFSKSGVGKSMLGVQVADAITKGTSVNGFTTELPAQKVLYFDFSTSDRQFSRRYEGYAFSDNFIRITLNTTHWELKKFGGQLVAAMETALQEHGAKVIVIDSLDTLKFFVNEIFFLSHLLRLKEKMGLSILLLAGAKKVLAGKPILLGNLAAHKMVAGFAGSVFAMGTTQPEGDNRYLIHLKGAEHGKVYHQDNVAVMRCNLSAPGSGQYTGLVPCFEFVDYETEDGQLNDTPLGLDALIVCAKKENPLLSLGEIARELDTNKMKVKRVLDRYYRGVTAVTPNSKSGILNSKPERLNGESSSNTAAPSLSNPGLQPGGKNGPAKKLSYSQQLRQRLAQARMEKQKA